MYRNTPKLVSDPVTGVVNIRPVLPIIETREFQALAGKSQLGMTSWVFRGAHHTRFEHCIGSYKATRERAERWVQDGSITKEAGDALAVYALVHDIGHPAFSHVTEDFCELDDDEMTLQLVRGVLKKRIEEAGVNHALVEAFASRENPLYLGVHDKNLGTEKLDYLERDGFYAGIGRPPGIQYLREWVYYTNGIVAIDEKIVDHTADTQNFYMKMYKEVYLRKALVIAQRMFHKMVHYLVRGGELSPGTLPFLIDAELVGLLAASKEPMIQRLYQALRERKLFCEAVSIRPQTSVQETRVADKSICVIGISHEDMLRLVHAPMLQKKNHEALDELEREIAGAFGLPEGDVLVVPVFNPERFHPKDVRIYGSDNQFHSLRERRLGHYQRLEEIARSYVALRICTTREHRAKLCAAGKEVYGLLSWKLE